jgi:Outer membrane efflux protein
MLKKALILVLFGPGCIFAQGTPKPTPSAQVQSSGKTQRLHPAPPGKASSIASSSKTVEGPPKRLTIKEAESIALRNSPVLGSAYFNAQAAKDVVKEVRSQFFPQVQGIIEAVGTSNAIRNAFAGTNHTAPQIRIGASGALNNSLILSREAQGFNISQLIFDFGRTANLAAAAQFDALSQAQKAQLVRAQVVYRVDRAYLNVLKAKAMLNVAQQTVTNRQVILNEITALFQNKLKSDYAGSQMYYPHLAYFVKSENGWSVRCVANHLRPTDEIPTKVQLAAGRYTLIAETDGLGKVRVQIQITTGTLTKVTLQRFRGENDIW